MNISIFKNILAFLFLILINPLLFSQQNILLGELEHDGLTRNYRLFIPKDYNGVDTLPLVFNLHGFGSSAFEQEWYSTMNFVADTARFFACSPNGIDKAWNVGWAFGSTADDVGFVSSLIDELSSLYNINPKRIYSCGMSNGGFMSYRLACELNDKIAAIASVTGSMVPSYLPQCDPGKAVPVMQIHGTNDLTVPYTGNPTTSLHIDSLVHYWVENNNCVLSPDTTIVADINTSDQSTAFRVDYRDCEDETMVSFYKIENGEHTWPSSTFDIGVTNRDFNASIEIWKFFKQFELDATISNISDFDVAEKIKIYPNPAANILFIDSDQMDLDSSYEILNIEGQLLFTDYLDNNINSVNISYLRSGIYTIKIKIKDLIVCKLFVKH